MGGSRASVGASRVRQSVAAPSASGLGHLALGSPILTPQLRARSIVMDVDAAAPADAAAAAASSSAAASATVWWYDGDRGQWIQGPWQGADFEWHWSATLGWQRIRAPKRARTCASSEPAQSSSSAKAQ